MLDHSPQSLAYFNRFLDGSLVDSEELPTWLGYLYLQLECENL